MNICIIDQEYDRALHIGKVFSQFNLFKIKVFYDGKNGDGDNIEFEMVDSEFKEAINPLEDFDIVLRHGKDVSNIGGSLNIAYGGFGIDEHRSLRGEEEILTLTIGNTENTEEFFTSEVASSIISYYSNKGKRSKYLITQEERSELEYELKKRYNAWRKNSDDERKVELLLSPSEEKEIFVILNSAVFAEVILEDTLNREIYNKLEFTRQKLRPLMAEIFPQFNFKVNFFESEDALLKGIQSCQTNKTSPFAVFITAEHEDKNLKRLSAFHGIDVAQTLRLKGYKGLIFIGTMVEPVKWREYKGSNLFGKTAFMDSNYTFTMFLNSDNLIDFLEINELAEIADIKETKGCKAYEMSNEILSRVIHTYIDPAGIISRILHNNAHIEFTSENCTVNLNSIFEQLSTVIDAEFGASWNDLKAKILKAALDKKYGLLYELLNDYKDEIIEYCYPKNTNSSVAEKNNPISILFVDDNLVDIYHIMAYFKSHSDFICHYVKSVDEAISKLEEDRDGNLIPGQPNSISIVITDWVFYRLNNENTLRLSLLQGIDLVHFINKGAFPVELIALTNKPKTFFEEFKDDTVKKIFFFEKSIDFKVLEYQVRLLNDNGIKNLFEEGKDNFESWHVTTSKFRLAFANWIYYKFYKRSNAYYENEEFINKCVRSFIQARKERRELTNRELFDLNIDRIKVGSRDNQIPIFNKLTNSNPSADLSGFRNKLLARRVVLSFVKLQLVNRFESITSFLFAKNIDAKYESEGLNRFLFLGDSFSEISNNVRELKKNLLPEEIAFLKSLE
jgi:hypothetical protein